MRWPGCAMGKRNAVLGAIDMAIEWIKVSERVPNDRRKVLVAYSSPFLLRPSKLSGAITRYNPGGCFDIEKGGSWIPAPMVTHWAELELPSIEA